jgi:hypothetical protein
MEFLNIYTRGSSIRFKRRDVNQFVASPVNKPSIAIHTRLKFQIVKGTSGVDGVRVTVDYDGIRQDRVLFVKVLK